ncbi:hypothetical protein [Micromonospora sp. ATA51]|uniref:hypothetical protein n=1 Tax=Micromonospora sp. ATA51 TaxID=2806098 RepID=UPI001A644D9E|nr:hypothetical protein [Micromonospora sp. ATA51]MBM0227657.1 hypothetical protein [Micromonospora sp. ATA51]
MTSRQLPLVAGSPFSWLNAFEYAPAATMPGADRAWANCSAMTRASKASSPASSEFSPAAISANSRGCQGRLAPGSWARPRASRTSWLVAATPPSAAVSTSAPAIVAGLRQRNFDM